MSESVELAKLENTIVERRWPNAIAAMVCVDLRMAVTV